jgi:hypothetical protein
MIDPLYGALGAGVLQAGTGIYAANKAADAQEDAAKRAAETARRNMLMQLQLQEPQRNVGYQALGDLASLYGYSTPAYTPVNTLMQSQTPLKSKAIKQGLKQGMGLDQLQQMGTLGQVNAKSLRRLTKMGLSGDDILKLQGMGGQPQQAPQAQNHAQPTGQAGNMDRFFASPDYQFRRDEGQRGIGNSFAARGGAASGNALKALTEFNSNLASGEFGNYYNRLAGMAGMGSQATGNVAGAGNNYANALMGSQQAAGDARASGVMGGANSVMQGVNTGVNAYLWGKYMNQGRRSRAPGRGILARLTLVAHRRTSDCRGLRVKPCPSTR